MSLSALRAICCLSCRAILLAVGFCSASPLAAQDQKDIMTLEPSRTIEREIAERQNHQYQINLNAEQCLQALVTQEGIDLSVMVFDPDGKQIANINNTHSRNRGEHLLVVGNIPGVYRVMIRPTENVEVAGR